MRQAIVWARLLGLGASVAVRGVEWDAEAGVIVAKVKPRKRKQLRCGWCGRPCPRYDSGEGPRRWRALDLGTIKAFVRAGAPRVECPKDGVIVAEVPWARYDARFTRSFEDQAAWMAVHVSKTTLAEVMRTTWRTVGNILVRVSADQAAKADPFADLTRIGIDEVSFRKGQRYLTVVVNHDTGLVVWAAEGADEATLEKFFALLGAERTTKIEVVTADAASWIRNVVVRRCPEAKVCMDTFHVVAWATDALDSVRREVWNAARRSGQHALARALKGSRYALWKNPEDLTKRQKAKLAQIAHTNSPLYRAYLLKEQLRQVFRLPPDEALELLNEWLKWAQRCRLAPFRKVARTIRGNLEEIEQTLRTGLTNARVESVNTRIRLLTRIAFGFHSSQPLIGLVMLALGGLCPPLPGRAA